MMMMVIERITKNHKSDGNNEDGYGRTARSHDECRYGECFKLLLNMYIYIDIYFYIFSFGGENDEPHTPDTRALT